MKKRIFIPYSFVYILLQLFFCALLVLLVVVFIQGLTGEIELSVEDYIKNIFVFPVGIAFLSFTVYRFVYGFTIVLKTDHIFKGSDLLPKYERIQYKCTIAYNDIKNISIVASEKNSKNQRIKSTSILSIPKKYLEFTLISGKIERICIHYYTKRQIIKLLNFINMNMKQINNPNVLLIDEIMKDWYTFGGYNREDLKIKRGEKIKKKRPKK